MNIELIHLQGFKSAADVQLAQVEPFVVMAGPNGAGKSNLADGLAFFAAVIKRGAEQAISDFGGYTQIHCFQPRLQQPETTASLTLKIILSGQSYHYDIAVHQMNNKPWLEEKLHCDGKVLMTHQQGAGAVFRQDDNTLNRLADFPAGMSVLMLLADSPLYRFITNIKVFRFEPLSAKVPDSSSADTTILDSHGHNVATMLSVLEKNPQFNRQIIEWIELLVPGVEGITTEKQHLDGSTVILFKEEGSDKPFPARLISDGTIYALCIMTALLSRSGEPGLTLIEEPERGIHPQAIAELVALMRDHAQVEHPVFVTSHSESVVRSTAIEELWLVNKVAGKTGLKNAAKSAVALGDLNLDSAWLMNFFDGGLPW